MPNILVRGHMRFDDSIQTSSFEEIINKITNCDEMINKSTIDLNEEMICFLKILNNRINELDNLKNVNKSELKKRMNDDSKIMMKEIFIRYFHLLKKMNLTFDDLLE
jgi:hypothetical protein